MTRNAALKRDLGKVALALDEIETLLEEARLDEQRGEEAPLEPPHVFLRRARER